MSADDQNNEATPDDIDTDAPDTHSDAPVSDVIVPKTRRKLFKGFWPFAFILGAVFGGLVGGYIPKYLDKSPDKLATFSNQTNQSINTLETALSKNQKTIAKLKANLDAISKKNTKISSLENDLGIALDGLNTRMETLAKQVETLSEAPKETPQSVEISKALKTLQGRMDALEALKGAPGDENAGAQALNARLAAMEKRVEGFSKIEDKIQTLESDLSKLETQAPPKASFPTPDTKPIKLPEISDEKARSSALEILIDTFPREKMLEAVKAQEVLAQNKPGLLRRMLDKHIKTKKSERPDPRFTIDKAYRLTKNGEIKEAIATIQILNPPVRSIAANWVKSAKIYLKSQP